MTYEKLGTVYRQAVGPEREYSLLYMLVSPRSLIEIKNRFAAWQQYSPSMLEPGMAALYFYDAVIVAYPHIADNMIHFTQELPDPFDVAVAEIRKEHGL